MHLSSGDFLLERGGGPPWQAALRKLVVFERVFPKSRCSAGHIAISAGGDILPIAGPKAHHQEGSKGKGGDDNDSSH
jgi:hypothetical protein